LDIDGAEWPASWFPESMWFDQWPTVLPLRVMALDPSKGKDARAIRESTARHNQHGDYSAFIMLGRDNSGTLWVEADLDYMRTTTKIVTDGITLATRFAGESGGQLDGFGVESDQFQELMADEYVRVSKAAGIMLPVYLMSSENTPKDVRIRRLTPYLS